MLVVAHRVPADARGCAVLTAAGAGAFEADVQCRRGQVVVSHHLPFLRVPGWLEHDGARFRWGGGRVLDPTLVDVLARVPSGAVVLLDPKESSRAGRRDLVEAVAAAVPEAQRARLRVSTADVHVLDRYRELGIAAWRTVADARALRKVLAAPRGRHDGVSIRHTLVDADVVAALHEILDTVVAWTVNDVATARRLAADGVDGVTTDNPDVMRALSG